MGQDLKAIEDYLVAAYEAAHKVHTGGNIKGMHIKREVANAIKHISPQRGIEYSNRIMQVGDNSIPATIQVQQSSSSTVSGFGTTPPSQKFSIGLKKKNAAPAPKSKPLAKPVSTNMISEDDVEELDVDLNNDPPVIPQQDLERIRAAKQQGKIKTVNFGTDEKIASLTPQVITRDYKASIDPLLAKYATEGQEIPSNIMQKAALLKKLIIKDLESKK